jgi:hypothetical protein
MSVTEATKSAVITSWQKFPEFAGVLIVLYLVTYNNTDGLKVLPHGTISTLTPLPARGSDLVSARAQLG